MRTVLGLTAAAILALPAAADVAPITPAPVVAAERAFAADGAALGFKASFLKHSAPDAIVIQPEPLTKPSTTRRSKVQRARPPAIVAAMTVEL